MADCLGDLKVDDEFEPSRLFDGKVGWLGTLQHFGGYASALTIYFREAGAVGNKSAPVSIFGPLVYRRQAKRRNVPDNVRCIDVL